jgi:hypothetical protein
MNPLFWRRELEKSPTKLHFFTLSPTLDEAILVVKRIQAREM